nr:hypothetical protein [Tanacetum cinerariifolium]
MHFLKASPFGLVSMYRKNRDRHCGYHPIASIGRRSLEPAAMIPVVKPTSIHIVLSLAVTHDWPIHELDVKNAFLHGQLSETIYMHQPPGFLNSTNPDYVCHLQRSFLADALQYLTFTRTDISYDVHHICLYMHDPHDPHFTALKRILHYMLIGLVAMLPVDQLSAEYLGVANVVAETAWIQNLLLELHAPLTTATLVYYDNACVLHVPSSFQYVDIFTKGLPSALFLEFRSSLNVRRPPVQL